MKGNFIFVSVLLFLFASYTLSHYSVGWLVLVILWLCRLIIKKKVGVLVCSSLLCLLFFIRYDFINHEESILNNEEATLLIQVKLTSLTIDGNRLNFQGLVMDGEQQEEVIVRHTFSTEYEKEIFLNNQNELFVVEGVLSDPAQASNFHQFDYQDYLRQKRIYKILEAEHLSPVESELINRSVSYKIDSIRQSVLSFIDIRLSPETAVYIKALLFADKRELTEPINQSFRELGIVHLLSISGLHIHFLITGLKKLLNKIGVTRETSQWVLFIILPVYGFLTGFGVSVFRAIGQAWLGESGEITRFKLTTLDSWCVVFCLSLLINPFSLLNVGFQLSYFISFLIITLTSQPYFKEYKRMKASMIMSLVIFAGSLPILSYHFFEFSWGVLFLNSLYIPFLSLVLLPMLIILLLSSLLLYETWMFTVLLRMTDGMITIMEEMTLFISRHTSLSIITGRLSLIALITFTVSFIVLVLMIEVKQSKQYTYILPIIGLLISVFSVRYSPFGVVMMIDVGQGESILIKEPWGKGNYLIDTGGTTTWRTEEPWEVRQSVFSLGEDTVVPVLKAKGVHQLDTVIITHPDWDHYGALSDIVKHIPVNTLFTTESTLNDSDFLYSLQPHLTSKTKLRTIENVTERDLPMRMRAIYPLKHTAGNNNNESLVLLGIIGEYSWLFTGDLEKEGEHTLISMYPNLKVDVLKVGHHGSNTSTSDYFLEHLSPNYALISAGRNNSYGHPHPDVVKRLQNEEIHIYQTNTQGAVQYMYASNWFFESFLNATDLFQTKMSEKE